MLLLGRKSAAEKMASFLVEMTERLGGAGCRIDFEHPGRRILTLPFSRQQIADVLGLTIETVSRVFTQFKTSGLIQLLPNNEVALPDPEALKALGEGAA